MEKGTGYFNNDRRGVGLGLNNQPKHDSGPGGFMTGFMFLKPGDGFSF